MAQIKKAEVEERIIAAAYTLFRKHGYAGTRMPQIAKKAGMSAGNVYIYFKSKIDILLSIYEDWFSEKLYLMQQRFDDCNSPEQRLNLLFTTMWQELPAADNGFCGVLVEALADRSNQANYSTQLRDRVVTTLVGMLQNCLPEAEAHTHHTLAIMLLMAFDGYALNYHLHNGKTATNAEIDALCQMVFATHGTPT